MNAFDAIDWPYLETLAWVMTRDRGILSKIAAHRKEPGTYWAEGAVPGHESALREVSADKVSLIHVTLWIAESDPSLEQTYFGSMDGAEQAIIEAARAGRLSVEGKRDLSSAWESIPAKAFRAVSIADPDRSGIECELRPEPGGDWDAPRWCNFLFNRDEVLSLWPENREFPAKRSSISRVRGGRPPLVQTVISALIETYPETQGIPPHGTPRRDIVDRVQGNIQKSVSDRTVARALAKLRQNPEK